MAYCTYCGRDISPAARMCPNCGQPQGGTAQSLETAEWGTRVVASIVDGLVSALGFLPMFLFAFGGGYAGGAIAVLVVGIAWAVLHKPYFEGRSGQSAGKKATGIRLVREDGSDAGMGLAFGRWAVTWAIGLVPFGNIVDSLWPLWGDRKQTLHDKAVKTLVVRT